MLVIGWLWHKNLLGVEGRFDEMMGPNICHNLRSGIDLRVKLLLEANKLGQLKHNLGFSEFHSLVKRLEL